MKISNFVLLEVTGTSVINYRYKASIDVTMGLFKKKIKTRKIGRSYLGPWFFFDSGEFVPRAKIDPLERLFTAKCGKDLEHCLD